MKYFQKEIIVSAEQWYPDPVYGSFKDDKDYKSYNNKKIGYDKQEVEYTVCDIGLQTKRGFLKVLPGDWIVEFLDGQRYPFSKEVFDFGFRKLT